MDLFFYVISLLMLTMIITPMEALEDFKGLDALGSPAISLSYLSLWNNLSNDAMNILLSDPITKN